MFPNFSIINLIDGQLVNHSLVILRGQIKPWIKVSFELEEVSVSVNEHSSCWPIHQNTFKILVPLKLDENQIKICYGPHQIDFKLIYKPIKRSRYVRLVYIICQNDSGDFQAPQTEDNSLSSAKNRIILGAKLIQAVMAQTLKDSCQQFKTFSLEEENREVVCHEFYTRLTKAKVHAMSQQELWCHFAEELMNSSLGDENCKFLAFLSATAYICPNNIIPKNHSEVMELTKGYVALGGGGLALFGTACLYTWAENYSQLSQRLIDKSLVDRNKMMDDSCSRGYLWSCYSTGLGSTLHELAHTFDLGHSERGIMGLGFHEIIRELISVNTKDCCLCPKFSKKIPLTNLHQSSKVSSKGCYSCGDGSFWIRCQALLLSKHKWFNDDQVDNQIKPIVKCSNISYGCEINLVEIRDVLDNNLGFNLYQGSFVLDLKSLKNLVSSGFQDEIVLIIVQLVNGELFKHRVDMKQLAILE